jgi:hypothetical protein
MAKTNKANDAAKKKAAKEKKMLVVLALVLVLALGYAYKTLTKLNKSSEPAPVGLTTASTSTTPSTTASPPASTPASTPAASAPVDVPSGTPPASTGSSGLISAVTPPLAQGQLRTFTLLDSKDPFYSDGPRASGTSSGAGADSHGTPSTSQPPQSKPKATTPTQQPKPSKPAKIVVPAPTSAVIAVNGTKALVTAASDFPLTSDPATNGLFRLVSLTRTTAKIAIVGGSYASGAATLTLHVDQPVTLANTADGTRYTLELFPQGTTVPPPPVNGTTTPSTTTPTTTTPAPATAPTS